MIEKLVNNFANPKGYKPFSKEAVLDDFKTCYISREASMMGRKEVLTGKAKFGILGDGKEVAQVALSYAFQKGDFRSGYYRDQTLMFSLGVSTLEDYFAQIYADPDNDPFSGGRQMNNHFATPFIDSEGNWTNHTGQYNISSDVSNTGGQMARALGLAFASKKYREVKNLHSLKHLTNKGNEVCFCTIGDASTSEGVFWETMNAAGVMQVPLAVFVWDDGYGISVPKKYQTVKESISEALSGFEYDDDKGTGVKIFKAKGWDYASLVNLFTEQIAVVRKNHIPALFHIDELTQPQGHSTSGSHERYKSKERLQWEKDTDCLKKMEEWIIREGFATEEECDAIKKEAKKEVRMARDNAWKAYSNPTKKAIKKLKSIYLKIPNHDDVKSQLGEMFNPVMSDIYSNGRKMYFRILGTLPKVESELKSWLDTIAKKAKGDYESFLYSESKHSALKVKGIAPKFSKKSPQLNGYQILNTFFDLKFKQNDLLFAFGEDVGKIGDVNQGFAGLQQKYSEKRIFDAGIREWTIVGQAIGMAMRGLRPIAEIQYLDYLIYGLEPLVDDLATLRWRSDNLQQAPAIIRTRGHRLEGIWHSGSPMGMILNSIKGIYLCVPRNMTQAAGMYNTLLQSDDPAIVIECLNGYRLKEYLPDNLNEFSVPLGVPEVIQEGDDITLVTYGSCVRIARAGLKLLEKVGISVELIDVQTLMPFDLPQIISKSIEKTNRVIFMDEDVPGGGTAYMMREVLERQGAYHYLDSKPLTLTAKEHRPPYGSMGDYFSKPNAEDVFEEIYKIMYEADPDRFKGNL